MEKLKKKYLKSENYKKLPMMVEKQETKFLKRYHIKIFFLTEIYPISLKTWLQFLINEI